MFKRFNRTTADTVERAADQIADPLERLRYLRQHAPGRVEPSGARKLPKKPIAVAAAGLCGLAALAILPNRAPARTEAPAAPVLAVEIPSAGPPAEQVWQVESSPNEAVYSNGLHVDLSFATRYRPRGEYPIFGLIGAAEPVEFAHEPRGIVFHTTESDIAPFEESSKQRIEWLGQQLLQFVRREHSYHYVIDRYGRVYRIVEESDAANHAGYSVWGDSRGLYVNLNDSFIGVAFEGRTGQRQDITAAQVSAVRMLTEMLRARYSIPPEDCVTHAQVSVAPWNMQIGHHVDWAVGFPWASLSLPDNYNLRIPSVIAFGFAHDEALTKGAGGQDWSGLVASDRQLRDDAASQSATEMRYRGMLRHRYREVVADLHRRQRSSKGFSESTLGPGGEPNSGEI